MYKVVQRFHMPLLPMRAENHVTCFAGVSSQHLSSTSFPCPLQYAFLLRPLPHAACCTFRCPCLGNPVPICKRCPSLLDWQTLFSVVSFLVLLFLSFHLSYSILLFLLLVLLAPTNRQLHGAYSMLQHAPMILAMPDTPRMMLIRRVHHDICLHICSYILRCTWFGTKRI